MLTLISTGDFQKVFRDIKIEDVYVCMYVYIIYLYPTIDFIFWVLLSNISIVSNFIAETEIHRMIFKNSLNSFDMCTDTHNYNFLGVI